MQEGDQVARYSMFDLSARKVRTRTTVPGSWLTIGPVCLESPVSRQAHVPTATHHDRHKPSEQLRVLLLRMPLVQPFSGEDATKDLRSETHRSFEIGDATAESISGATENRNGSLTQFA
jgi:hypothetical protein